MFLSTVVGGLFSAPGVGGAQPAGRIARVGYLASVPRAESGGAIQVFVAKLSEMGFIEGQNLVIEFRHGDSQVRLRAVASELIGLGVQVIHAANPYALQAAREVTTTVPIVGYDLESDPVAAGFAASLARPGGNITGVFLDQPEVSGKLLQFLTEMVPGLSRVAVLWDAPLASAQLKALEDAASRLRLMILPIVWHGPGELLRPLSLSVKEGARGLVVLSSPRIHDRYLPFVADAALKHRLPSISLSSAFVRNGGLIAYGPVTTDMRRAAAALVVKILGGARPAELPIERPARFELTINPKTARALGLTIPPALLLRADQVIE